MRTASANIRVMDRDINVRARWDADARVWTATSADVPGLVAEADTWQSVLEEVRLIVPDLLELSNKAR